MTAEYEVIVKGSSSARSAVGSGSYVTLISPLGSGMMCEKKATLLVVRVSFVMFVTSMKSLREGGRRWEKVREKVGEGGRIGLQGCMVRIRFPHLSLCET